MFYVYAYLLLSLASWRQAGGGGVGAHISVCCLHLNALRRKKEETCLICHHAGGRKSRAELCLLLLCKGRRRRRDKKKKKTACVSCPCMEDCGEKGWDSMASWYRPQSWELKEKEKEEWDGRALCLCLYNHPGLWHYVFCLLNCSVHLFSLYLKERKGSVVSP